MFKKGQSGNPGGRPKSNLNKLLGTYLRGKDPKEKKARELVLIEKLYAMAVAGAGDLGAIRELFDRVLGKPAAIAEVKADGPVPLMLVMGDEKGGEARNGDEKPT